MSFEYRGDVLCTEGVSTAHIAEKVGTPFYCYSMEILQRNVQLYQRGLRGLNHLIAYSVKANSNIQVLRKLASLGVGADVVSGGELRRALHAGIDPRKIVFSGVGKTKDEIEDGLEAGILMFNVESLEELETINKLASRRGINAPVSIRINPDIAAETHTNISTGRAEDKFGIPVGQAIEALSKQGRFPSICFVGLDIHIGSQITKPEPFRAAFESILRLLGQLRSMGVDIQYLDIGGGLGVNYGCGLQLSIPRYCELVQEVFADFDGKLILEPGRSIVAEAGILVTSVVRVKKTSSKVFVILDAGMNDFMRPALYGAVHAVVPVEGMQGRPDQIVDLVGPVCESTDTFASNCLLPELCSGDLIAFEMAGAYGASLASEYNTRAAVPEVLVDGDHWSLIRRRPSIEEIIARDITPDWSSESMAKAG